MDENGAPCCLALLPRAAADVIPISHRPLQYLLHDAAVDLRTSAQHAATKLPQNTQDASKESH
jgi:hypothetical protein